MKLRSASDMILLRESGSQHVVCTAGRLNKTSRLGRLAPPQPDDETTSDDQRPAQVDGRCGGLVKSDLGQYLRHQKKHHNVNAQQLAKIPVGNIDGESVKAQNQRAEG